MDVVIWFRANHLLTQRHKLLANTLHPDDLNEELNSGRLMSDERLLVDQST